MWQQFKQKPLVLFLCGVVVGFAVCWLPGQRYYYTHQEGGLIRINRITGTTWALHTEGWVEWKQTGQPVQAFNPIPQ